MPNFSVLGHENVCVSFFTSLAGFVDTYCATVLRIGALCFFTCLMGLGKVDIWLGVTGRFVFSALRFKSGKGLNIAI